MTGKHEAPPLTAGEVEWILSNYITRADMDRRSWLQIISALANAFGDEKATDIMLRHFPDEQKNETWRAAHGALRASTKCGLGSIIELARRCGGFNPQEFMRARRASF